MTLDETIESALAHHEAGRLAEAEALYRQALGADPNDADALHGLGLLAYQHGQTALAVELLSKATEADPESGEFLNNLAVALLKHGDYIRAEAAARAAILLEPDHPQAHNNLANSLKLIGRLDEAIAEYEVQLRLTPRQGLVQANLGIALYAAGKLEQSIAACRRAVELQPALAEAWNQLGRGLKDIGDLEGSLKAYRRAISSRPEWAEAYCGLADTLATQGRVADAIAAYRTAVQINPDCREARDGLLYRLHFSPDHDAAAILREHQPWAAEIAPLARLPARRDRSGSRRLRIGYVSPDFREHVVGRNLRPILSHRNRQKFEVFCYSDVRQEDEMTSRLRSLADHWRPIAGMPDERVAGQIRADGIDILVDLAHHMANNRLPVFAEKPVPVQATHLGCSATTGLPAIDYRITDPHIDPPGESDTVNAERLVRLPGCYWCYAASQTDVPVNPLPALTAGQVTFGSLNLMYKVTPAAVELWSRVLRATPGSRFLLHAHGGRESHRYVLGLFESHGVDPARIELAGRRPFEQYLKLYHRIDIGLDTMPYTGHMTSLDSFWMGVPVVTLAGGTAVARGGVSVAMNLELPELIARSGEQYVSIAGSLAADLPRLAAMRGSLRARLQRSPLMDAAGYARELEAAYLAMWENTA